MLAPEIPDPTSTYLAAAGRCGVVRWSEIGSGGVCQYAFVGFGYGSPTSRGQSSELCLTHDSQFGRFDRWDLSTYPEFLILSS
jgi:hypothetical protein